MGEEILVIMPTTLITIRHQHSTTLWSNKRGRLKDPYFFQEEGNRGLHESLGKATRAEQFVRYI